jgi:hypothetical protein
MNRKYLGENVEEFSDHEGCESYSHNVSERLVEKEQG